MIAFAMRSMRAVRYRSAYAPMGHTRGRCLMLPDDEFDDDWDEPEEYDGWFDDMSEPIEAYCDLENPDVCESCQ